MKNEKAMLRPYTRQFYRGNRGCFLLVLCQTVLNTVTSLLVSWLMQQLIDLIGGSTGGFSLLQLTGMTAVLIGVVTAEGLMSYYAMPRFVTSGISQYREYVFGELTKKNISAFSGESSSTYVSALTNDIAAIGQGYLRMPFTLLESLLTFFGAMLLMLWYSPLLTVVAIGLSLLPLAASILTGNRVADTERRVSDRNEAYTSALRDGWADSRSSSPSRRKGESFASSWSMSGCWRRRNAQGSA